MTAPAILRFPITLRELTVLSVNDHGRHMRRVTLGGPQLGPFERDGRSLPALESRGPDDHVKLFFPDPATGTFTLPRQGDGRLHWPQDPPAISREYTPLGFDPDSGALMLDFLRHGTGIASQWVETVRPGAHIHVAGPKASMLPPEAPAFLLIGDETALPAVANWLDLLPPHATITAHLLARAPGGHPPLPDRSGATLLWHHHDDRDTGQMARLAGTPDPACFIWAAGERAAIAALRAHLSALGHPADAQDLSTYWTLGAASGD